MTGEGWVSAGELAAGDAIRDAAFRALTVLTVKRDPAPRIVHNLEVAGAHTYFAGELEAWGHNAKSSTNGNNSAATYGKRKHKCFRPNLPRIRLPSGKVVDAFDLAARKVYELKPDTPAQKRRGQRQVNGYACELSEMFGEEIEGVVETYPPYKGP